MKIPVIGVDIGGTQIKLAAFSADGALLDKWTRETNDAPDHGTPPKLALTVREMIQKTGGRPDRIGIAAPGLAAVDGFSISHMPGRLHGLEGFDWGGFFDVPVRALNDAHAALLGETWQGAARGLRHGILLTLGTGVGGAILSDGRLLKGALGRAGHLGHVCLNPNGKPDIVNTPGSLEDAIGESTLGKRSGGRFATTKELVAAFDRKDPKAGEIWLTSIHALGCAISSFINILDCEAVVIGGGIACAGPALFEPLAAVLDKTEWRPAGHLARIIPAQLGEWAGAYGAAFYSKDER